jgi:TP901 family phage tail tape measure protein
LATTTKEIIARLKLDGKEFKSKLSDTHKSVLKLTAGLTAVTAAVVTAAKMTANYRDETIKAARAAGSTAEDFSALRHAANLSGLTIEQLTKGLQKLSNPAGQAKEQLERLGVSMTDASGNMKTQNQILEETADAISGLNSPAQRSGAALKIFGEEGAKMVNLLSGGSEGIRAMTEEAERMGLTFSQAAGEAAELFNDNITRLTGSIKGCVQQFSGGIIEFVNGTGIMDTLSEAVQSVTGFWRSLDEETRKTIVTVGAVVAGIAALTLAIAGVVAIAPAVGAAITVMTGGLNLVVVGIAAAIAAFVAIALAAAKYWDQVKTAIEPAIDSIKEAFGSLTDAVQPIIDVFSLIGGSIGSVISDIVAQFKDWFNITDDITGEISILGTIAKVTFAVIGSAIIVVIGAFRLLVDSIVLVGTALDELGVAFKAAVIDQDFDAAKAALGRIGDSATQLKNDFLDIGSKIKQSFSDIVVTVDTKKAKADIKNLKDDLNDLGGDAEKWTTVMQKYVSAIGGPIQQIGSMIGQVADMISQGIQDSLTRITRNMEIFSGVYSNQMDAIIKQTEEAENAKIALLNEKYDQQIAALEEAERRKNAAIEFASNERLLMMDEEYEIAKERAEEEFEARMEMEAEQYEIEKEAILQKALDKEQRMLAEQMMDQDFKLYMENQQAIHDANMNSMASLYAAKQKNETALLTATKKTLEEQSKVDITAITEAKNKAVETAEDQKNAKLIALEEKKQRDEKLLKKAQLLMN